MKLKASAPYIALLCSSLLLSLNWASAQKKPKSTSAKKSQAAPAQTPGPTPTPTLQGTYTIVDSAAATDKVRNAIEFSVKGMAFEGTARDKLKKTNFPPPQQITISYTSTEVSITTDQSGLIKTPANGGPIKWTRDGDKYDVSTKWVNGNLERTFRSSDGERINTYSLSTDGKTLKMQVAGTSAGLLHLRPSLTHPLEYELFYKRKLT